MNFEKIFLIAFVLAAFLLRIYRGSELFFWNIDEDIIGLTVKRILVDLRPQLIGFPIPGGIFLGPLFYYLISIPYLISFFDPQKLFLFSALLGSISTFLVYRIGAEIFEKRAVGIIASLVYAFSFFSVTYGRLLTGLSIAPVLALLTYLFLYRSLKHKNSDSLILLGLVLLVLLLGLLAQGISRRLAGQLLFSYHTGNSQENIKSQQRQGDCVKVVRCKRDQQ